MSVPSSGCFSLRASAPASLLDFGIRLVLLGEAENLALAVVVDRDSDYYGAPVGKKCSRELTFPYRATR
jgi:hypothetical protein